MNFNPGNPIDVIIGNAGFLVFDDSVSLAGVLLRYYEKVSEASCGRCTPCRTGSRLIELALRDLVEGRGAAVDWDHIYESAEQMMLTLFPEERPDYAPAPDGAGQEKIRPDLYFDGGKVSCCILLNCSIPNPMSG